MEPPTKPLRWEILTRGDPNCTFESLYIITETPEILRKLEYLVESITLQGTRPEDKWTDEAKGLDKKHQAEMRPLLDKIKLLCSPGQEWEKPNPQQHVLREEKPKEEEKRILQVRGTEQGWRFAFFPEAIIGDIIPKLGNGNNPDFKKFIEEDVRSNWYFLLPDLLGVFLSKLDIAPPQATLKNFYIPILALYARWVGVLLQGESTPLNAEEIGKFAPDPDFNSGVSWLENKQKSEQPNMYQITWTEPKEGSGEPHMFSLGASIGGYYGNLGKRHFGGLFRKARWDVCDRDKDLEHLAAEWKGKNGKKIEWKWAKQGGSIEPYRYGNCGETYTFLHMLSKRTEVEKKRTKGIALSPKGTTLDKNFDPKTPDRPVRKEYSYEYLTQNRAGNTILDFLTDPCGNCKGMISFYAVENKQFQPSTLLQ